MSLYSGVHNICTAEYKVIISGAARGGGMVAITPEIFYFLGTPTGIEVPTVKGPLGKGSWSHTDKEHIQTRGPYTYRQRAHIDKGPTQTRDPYRKGPLQTGSTHRQGVRTDKCPIRIRRLYRQGALETRGSYIQRVSTDKGPLQTLCIFL